MTSNRTDLPRRSSRSRPPLTFTSAWNNLKWRGWFYQGVVILGTIALGAYLISNVQSGLARQNISTGFQFLTQPAGFDIGEGLIAFSSSDSFMKAYAVGILNTLKVALVSIIFATFIGTIVGVGRLSTNLLVRKLSSVYVEVFRNTPQLVLIIFLYTLLVSVPHPRNAISLGEIAFMSNRGLALPWFAADFPALWFTFVLIVSVITAWRTVRWADARRLSTGVHIRIWPVSLAVVLLPPVLFASFFGASSFISLPSLQGFNFRGGAAASTEFLALSLGLSLYIGAFIAEIVRSGIQSILKGQIEAARSIGLRNFDIYRKVIFPQALRVMVPPATAQYVSVVKNSSLGVAIGYPELFNVNNTIVTLSGHTVEAIAIMMSIYLAISFLIAIAMNAYNKLVQIKER